MVSCKLLMAAALLTSSWEAPAAEEAPDLYAEVAPALRHLAMDWQFLDRRECDARLTEPEAFAADLDMLRERYQDLWNAPLVEEADRLPGRDIVCDLLDFNRSYQQALSSRLEVDTLHGDEVQAALAETDQLYRVWDKVRAARDERYFVTGRREALQDLRTLVGQRAFYTGQLPPHVPLWRFPAAD
jgi:hypothetical protein